MTGYYRNLLSRFSTESPPIVFTPWITIASMALLVRRFQAVLTRISYLALLMYWNVFVAKNFNERRLFSQLLNELMRWKTSTSSRGERNPRGKHYTIAIAEIAVLEIFGGLFLFLFPGREWTLTAIVVFLSLSVIGSPVAQLWMQKQVTRLVRWNKQCWQIRGLAIESLCLSISTRVDSRATRAIMWVWRWVSYQFAARQLAPELLSGLCKLYAITSLSGFHWPPALMTQMAKYLLFYHYWFRELGKFVNPNPPEHKYTPLKNPEDIRVILLYPRLAFWPICCTLTQGRHMSLLFYESISYTWGDNDLTEEILIDGCTRKVTKSVYEILAGCSSMFLPKLLWIDALCIDQQSEIEKSKQVQLMQRIYSNSLFVTVLLGRSVVPEGQSRQLQSPWRLRYDGIHSKDEGTRLHLEAARLAFDLINELHILDRGIQDNPYEAYEVLQNSFSKGKPPQWYALLKMLQHPWFERVWVVQEVALPPQVQIRYGDETINWDILAGSMKKIHRYNQFSLWLEWTHGIRLRHVQHTSLFNISRMHQLRQRVQREEYSRDGDPSLLELLNESFYFKATNPRDLIYGLMGICRDPIPIDYGASAETVYLNAAKELSDKGVLKSLLPMAGVGNNIRPSSISMELPSWIPDWTEAPKYERLRYLGAYYAKQTDFKAGGEAEPGIIIQDDRTLILSGVFLDVIDDLGPALFNTTPQAGQWSIAEVVQLATKYEEFGVQLLTSPNSNINNPYPYIQPDQPLREALLMTIVTDSKWLGWGISRDKFQSVFTEWETNLSFFLTQPDISSETAQAAIYQRLQSMDQITELVKSSCGGRRLFISMKGYIGLCPPYAMYEDVICVIPGISVPLVLRPVRTDLEPFPAREEPAKRCQLVGECYVHGLMNGEGLPEGILLKKLVIV